MESPGQVKSDSQVDGDSHMVSAYWSAGGGLCKGTLTSASTSVWKKAGPPVLIPVPDNLDPFHMALVAQ